MNKMNKRSILMKVLGGAIFLAVLALNTMFFVTKNESGEISLSSLKAQALGETESGANRQAVYWYCFDDGSGNPPGYVIVCRSGSTWCNGVICYE